MDLFQLVAKLSLDSTEYKNGISDAKDKLSKLGSGIKKGAAAVATASVAGITAATTAVGVLTKASLDGYANYEQMVGGVQKLYGNMGMSLEEYAKSVGKSTAEVQTEWQNLEAAQTTVLENAKNAYKTAGMSANQYMEIATSFSASLINSLSGDTQKAAEQTDVAMKAISDNWNTFGGDISMVQNAFMGFAKQNYTMLDNLKLGYGGTKNEMKRLVDDANAYAASIGQASNLSMENFSDIVTAIDLIQQKQNIAGTTAREASTTIEGSLNAVKAAWDNLVTGFSDPKADISQLVQNVITSGSTALSNLIPAFTQALSGIGKAITEVVPKIMENIPTAINTIAIPLVKSGTLLVQKILEGIQSAAPKIIDALPKLFDKFTNGLEKWYSTLGNVMSKAADVGSELLGKIGEGLVQGLPNFLGKVLPLISEFTGVLRENAGKLISAGLDLVVHLAQGIANSLPVLIENIPTIVTNIANIINDNAPKVLVAAGKIILILAQGIIKALPVLIANIPKILQAIWAVFTAVNWLNLGASIISKIGSGIKTVATNLPDLLRTIGEKAVNLFRSIDWANLGQSVISLIGQGLKMLITNIPNILATIGRTAFNIFKSINWIRLGTIVISLITTGLKSIGSKIWEGLKSIGKTAVEKFKSIDWKGVGIAIVKGIIRGILGVNLADALIKKVSGAYNSVKKFLGIASPSKLFRKNIGENIPKGIALGITDRASDIVDALNALNFKVPNVSDIAYANERQVPATADDVLDYMGGWEVQENVVKNDNKDITVILELDKIQLAKTVFSLYGDETQRRGVKLAGGIA